MLVPAALDHSQAFTGRLAPGGVEAGLAQRGHQPLGGHVPGREPVQRQVVDAGPGDALDQQA